MEVEDARRGPDRRRSFIDPKLKARRYQLEVLDKALEENTILLLETGCGKTLIAVLLISVLSHLIRIPSRKIAVFLVPNISLVEQQAKEIEGHTDLMVGKYWGNMSGDTWNHKWWKEQLLKYEVFVMTPQILFNFLHHRFLTMEIIELLIFDECHHAAKNHPYANIMKGFYHSQPNFRPKIFGMTASLVNVKVGGHGGKIEQQIRTIECMLDSKVYTLKDLTELNTYVPTPSLQTREFEPCFRSNTFKVYKDVLYNLKNKYLSPPEKKPSESTGEKLKMSPVVDKKQLELISIAYNSLEYCLYELGLWCTCKEIERLLDKDGLAMQTDINKCSAAELFLREALSVFKSSLSPDDGCINLVNKEGHVDARLLSSKLICLIQALLECRETHMKSIVFVDRVVVTRVLASLLGQLPCLSFLKCLPLVGTQSMTQTAQQQTIERFRSGEVNLLVATDVAEEGLDIQSCYLVIRFDTPKTNRSFIQSRGRARQLGSNYIILVERGNQDQLDSVSQLMQSEDMMWGMARNRDMLATPIQEQTVSPEEEFFTVKLTGATVTTDYSVPLLNRYVSKLPGDEFYRPKAEFSYSQNADGFICQIRLPSTAPFQYVSGNACQTMRMARRVACVEACKKLHAEGALTDYLLPVEAESEETDSQSSKCHETDPSAQKDLHSTRIPTMLQGHWLEASERVCLFAYRLSITAFPKDRDYANIALYLESDLDENTKKAVTDLFLPRGRLIKAQLIPTGKVEFDCYQLRQAQLFQEKILKIALDDRKGKKKTEESSETEWNQRRLYLILPLLESPIADAKVDWNRVRKITSDVSFKSPGYFEAVGGTAKPVASSVLGKVFYMADGSVPEEAIKDAVVETTHTDEMKLQASVYCVVDVLWHINANSKFPNSEFQTYTEYYMKRYSLELKHPNQPLLKVKALKEVENLLTKRPEKISGPIPKKEILVELPPELCNIKYHGLSSSLVNTVWLVPSIMYHIETLLVARELQQMLATMHCEGAQVETILWAITTARCQEKYSLERLELFGDSFLKLTVSKRLFLIDVKAHEGQLTSMRSKIICNSYLHKLGVACGLPTYIRDTLFNPHEWVAPGRCKRVNCKDISPKGPMQCTVNCYEGHRSLQNKTIADVVEALIGAHLVDGGPNAALAFMKWLGIEVDFDARLKSEASARSKVNLQHLNDTTRLNNVEDVLGYKFQNKALLVEALTHSTYRAHDGHCYQRLEFLGDAVLDFLVTAHLYPTFPDLPPGLLTDLRSATVSNECFARVAVRNNLQSYLLHNSMELENRVKEFVSILQNVSRGNEPFYGWESNTCPKVLGDLVESLAGAVLVDTGFNTDYVWRVFEPLLQPLVTPDTLSLHPVRELLELCQKRRFSIEFLPPVKQSMMQVTVVINTGKSMISETAEKGDKETARRDAARKALDRLAKESEQHPHRKLAAALPSHSGGSNLIQMQVKNDVAEKPKTFYCPNVGALPSHGGELPLIGLSKSSSTASTIMPAETPVKEDCNLHSSQSTDALIFDGLETSATAETICNEFLEKLSISCSKPGSPDTSREPEVSMQTEQGKSSPSSLRKDRNSGGHAWNSFMSVEDMHGTLLANKDVDQNETCLNGSTDYPQLELADWNVVKSEECYSFYNQPILPPASSIETATNRLPLILPGSVSLNNGSHPPIVEAPTVAIIDGLQQEFSAGWHGITQASEQKLCGNPRTELHELCAKYKWQMPTYYCSNRQGPDHCPMFTYVVRITFDGIEIECEGEMMKCKKRAMDSAATRAIGWLHEEVFC